MHDQTLLLGLASSRLREGFRANKLPLLSTFFVGLLCYMYAFTNKLLNHDEVQSLFMKGGTVTSGRWGLGGLDTVFPNYSMPWIYGILTVIFISVAVCLMIRILQIRNPVLQVLFGGCVMAFPSLIGTFGYMFTSSSFGLSFLMAALAVYLLLKKGRLYTVLALGCMVFSLSIYQSYISLAASLLVAVVIRKALREEALSGVLKTGVGYVLFLAASLGLYYAATQVILLLKDVTFNDYASGNLGFSLAGIPAAIAEAYTSFLRFFTEGYRGLMPTVFSQRLHLVCLAAGIVLLILCIRRMHSVLHILLVCVLICIFPLAVNCMYLFTAADSVHTLVLYGFVGLYGLLALLAQECLDSCRQKAVTCVGVNILTLSLAAILMSNIYLANQAWLNLHLRYENAYSFYTSLLSDLREIPQFQPGTPIALVGDYAEPAYYEEQFPFLQQLTGTKGFLPDSYSKARFLEYYLGVSVPFVSEEDAAALAGLPQVAAMNPYPYHGSIALIDDMIVIKLS